MINKAVVLTLSAALLCPSPAFAGVIRLVAAPRAAVTAPVLRASPAAQPAAGLVVSPLAPSALPSLAPAARTASLQAQSLAEALPVSETPEFELSASYDGSAAIPSAAAVPEPASRLKPLSRLAAAAFAAQGIIPKEITIVPKEPGTSGPVMRAAETGDVNYVTLALGIAAAGAVAAILVRTLQGSARYQTFLAKRRWLKEDPKRTWGAATEGEKFEVRKTGREIAAYNRAVRGAGLKDQWRMLTGRKPEKAPSKDVWTTGETDEKDKTEAEPVEGDAHPENLGWLARMRANRRKSSAPVSLHGDRYSGDIVEAAGPQLDKDGKPLEPRVTFEEVAGQEEAKADFMTVIDYLKDPAKYKKLNKRFKGYKGILLFGPPGTGKTLMARAVAGEANIPFMSTTGSDFINKYVGTGAAALREKLDELKKKAKGGPAIIFIDEFESIGMKREGGMDRSEETRTIAALLALMDGFQKDNVIFIAATNRPDTLDPALTRGGRFGLKIPVGLPDSVGREAILKVHTAGMALDPDVDLKILARDTPGLAGADLEEVAQQATIAAAQRNSETVSAADFAKSIDNNGAGGKERRLTMSKDEKKVIAYHEAGHAIANWLVKNTDPIRQITIVPHGLGALGFVQVMPTEERFVYSKSFLEDRIAFALGGRVAEELMTGDIWSGASGDFEQATHIAEAMVYQYGMSKLGVISMGPDTFGRPKVMSEAMRRKGEREVQRILDEQLNRVRKMLGENTQYLEKLAAALIENETLRAGQFEAHMPPKPDHGSPAAASVPSAPSDPE